MNEGSFKAPWGAPLMVMTIACAVIILLVPVPGVYVGLGKSIPGVPKLPSWIGWMLVAVPVLTIIGSALFMVRGYVLEDEQLVIRRLGWATTLDLSRLTSANFVPDALRGSIRIFGNGGFFAFVGLYRNKELGSYRAYVTDAKRSVVLKFEDRTVVVTPDDPQKFVAEINARVAARGNCA